MRALVTGGAGFIGSNLVDALLARGDDVSVVDDLSTGRRENLDGALAAGARLHEASITDGEAMTALLAAERPDVVFHLAAQVDVRRAVADPAYDAAVNVGGTAVMLDAARAAGTRRFLLASTGGRDLRRLRPDPDPRGRPRRPDLPLRRVQGRRGDLPRALPPAPRPLDLRPAPRQRLRPAPGSARRGRRGRHLLSRGRQPARPCACSATDARRVTSSTSGTWWRRSSRRRSATPRAPTTSARGRRRACSTSWSDSGSRPRSSRSGRARSGALPSTRARPPRHWGGAPRSCWRRARAHERT